MLQSFRCHSERMHLSDDVSHEVDESSLEQQGGRDGGGGVGMGGEDDDDDDSDYDDSDSYDSQATNPPSHWAAQYNHPNGFSSSSSSNGSSSSGIEDDGGDDDDSDSNSNSVSDSAGTDSRGPILGVYDPPVVYTKRKRTGSANLRKPIPFAAAAAAAAAAPVPTVSVHSNGVVSPINADMQDAFRQARGRDEAKARQVYRDERRVLAFEGMGEGTAASDAETGRGGELVRAAEARLLSEVWTWSEWCAAVVCVPPPQLSLDVYPLVADTVNAAVDLGDVRNLTVLDLVQRAKREWWDRYQSRVKRV